MHIVGDFRVINDKARRLEAGDHLTLPFEIPATLVHGGDQPKSVISVKFKLEGASGLTWELKLNGTSILTTAGSGSNLITTIEAFDANLLLHGENEIEIGVKQGIGAIRIEDSVVHYHVSV